LTAGDRAVIGAVVLNGGKEATEAGVFRYTLSGASVEGEKEGVLGVFDPGDFATFDIPIALEGRPKTVVVTMTAVAGNLSDAVRTEIPVVRYQTPEQPPAAWWPGRAWSRRSMCLLAPPKTAS
jgi:hypothetical protein